MRRAHVPTVTKVLLSGSLVASLVVATPLSSQELPTIPLGASVRISPAGATRQEGRLGQLSADSIWVRVPGPHGIRQQGFSLAEVKRLEVWQRDARTRAALHWSLGGAAIGLVAGALYARQDGGEWAILYVPTYALAGLVAGAVVGASAPPMRWVTVWPPDVADFPRRAP
jgi:hypothetical protein